MIRHYKSNFTRQEIRDAFANSIREGRQARDKYKKGMKEETGMLFAFNQEKYREAKVGIGYLFDLMYDLGLHLKPKRMVRSCKP